MLGLRHWEPLGQIKQAVTLPPVEKEPSGHDLAALGSEQYMPGGHMLQVVAEPLENDPALQATGETRASAHDAPGGHVMHAVDCTGA